MTTNDTGERRRRRHRPLRSLAIAPVAALVLSCAVFLPGVEEPASAAPSSFGAALEADYIDPDRVYSTDVRWWLGEASHTDETLLEEIQNLYDAGFRGVELCIQGDGVADDALYAYGSEMWSHKWDLMMNKLLDLGMGVYLTSGTNWATSNVPGLDPTSQAAMQNLTLGTGTVDAGGTLETLPAPASDARHAGAKLVTAYAYRVVEGDIVDPDSFVDLASKVQQGADAWAQNLDWVAPSDGTYRVFGIWTQGTHQTASPATEPSYATNYFDARGVDALKAFWEEHYLSDPELNQKILEGDVQLFMDSLEITYGSGFTWWAEDLASEFQKRKGYDITPHLFLLNGVNASYSNPYHQLDDTGQYRLDGQEEVREGIINDYQDVLTQLYMERMLLPLKEWLNSVGIETRAQISYGKPLEISEPAMAVDYPEAENLNQYNQVDIYRLWTGAAKLENKVLSSETGAELAPFNATRQQHLRDAYRAYAAGFQRMIWHVWSADYGYGNAEWPGYSPFNANQTAFHYMGERHPGAADYDEFNAHLGRVQQLLQTGKSRTDVGFVHQNWTQGVQALAQIGTDITSMEWQMAHQGVYYRSTELQDNGYTYDYFSPDFLFDDDVTFNTETKTVEQAGYKAVVLYQDWLDLEGAKRIRDWAEQGLKVVILEQAGSRTPFNDGKNEELAAVMSQLKTLDTVRTAEVFDAPADYFGAEPGGYDDNVLEKLQELGVEPNTGYSEPNLQLLTQTRVDEAGNEYAFVYNYDDGSYLDKSYKESVRNATHTDSISTDIVKAGEFVPYTIDAWTGEVTELADYRWEGGNTILPIDLDYNNIALLAFEKVDGSRTHIADTTADSARVDDGVVSVRAGSSGTVTTELTNGERHEHAVVVPDSFDITDWHLTVDSWRPNETTGDLVRTETINGLTTTNRKTSTDITKIDVELETLTTWDQIPEVGKAVSGTGHYEATFEWDAEAASGAYLDFGSTLHESMKVWINGQKVGGDVSTNPTKVKADVGGIGGSATIDDGTGEQVPLIGQDQFTGGVSWTKPIADVSPYLVDGANSIVIEYNSALSNVQLDRGVIQEQAPRVGYRGVQWWKNDQVYLPFGPSQAKLVPFVELSYGGTGEPEPTPSTPPTQSVDPTSSPGTGGTPAPGDGQPGNGSDGEAGGGLATTGIDGSALSLAVLLGIALAISGAFLARRARSRRASE